MDYKWTDRMHMTIDNDPYHETRSIGLWGSSIGWKSEDDRFDVRVWGKNLTDKDGIGYGLRVADIFEIASPIVEPRTYGVTVGYSF